jgi:hypothetical protein
MQQSFSPSRRPRRWLRLTALIAGIGALAVVGAALGRGLDAFDIGGVEAHTTIATPMAVAAIAPAPTFSPTPVAASPVATEAQRREAVIQPSPTPSPPALSPTPGRGGAGGSSSARVGEGAGADGGDTAPSRQPPARLPETSGDQMVLGLGALGIALYLAGVALFVMPRIFAGKTRRRSRKS